MPCPHSVPGSVLGARNTVVNNTETGANRSVCGTRAQEWLGPDKSLLSYNLLRLSVTLRIKFKLPGPS